MHSNALSLDGEWRVIFDHDNIGRRLGMEQAAVFFSREEIEDVVVPSCLEEYRQDYEGVAWYHRSFGLDPELRGRVIRLAFGAVNYRAEVWLNGQPVGYHEGGYTGFVLDVTEFVEFDQENQLIIRVTTPLVQRDVVIDGLARDEAPHWRGAIAGGIWQSVSLLVSGPVYTEQVFVRPLLAADCTAGTAAVSATLVNTQTQTLPVRIDCVITEHATGREHARVSQEMTVQPGCTPFTATADMGSFDLWSPDHPNLYVATLNLQVPDGLSFRKEFRFGMREFGIDGTDFVLNGKRTLIKGAFYEGLYPHSLVFPRDLSVLKRTFQNAKDGGLNLIRPWRKPQPPVVYDLADEMGLLMVGALPIECMDYWPRMTPQIYGRIDQEVSEMVVRDRNHPSIIMWEMFNELWRKPLIAYMHKTCLLARSLDPDRVIMDEAGGFARGASVYLPQSRSPVPVNDVHRYPGGPLNRSGYDFFRNLAKPPDDPPENPADETAASAADSPETGSKVIPGVLTNISEIGYGSMPNLSRNRARYLAEGNPITPDYRIIERLYQSYTRVLQETGIIEMFGSLDDFVKASQTVHSNANKLMVEACRLNPRIGGIMVHALTGGDWVVGAGLLDLFGEPKQSYYGTAKAFGPRYIAITPSLPNLVAGEPLEIRLEGVNDLETAAGLLSVTIADAAGTTVSLLENSRVELPQGISMLQSCSADTKSLRGACLVTVTLYQEGGAAEPIVTNTADLYVMEPWDFSAYDIGLLDTSGDIRGYTIGAGYRVHDFSADLSAGVPLFVSGVQEPQVMRQVGDWVHRGGSAVMLELPSGEAAPHAIGHRQTVRDYLPFDVVYMQGQDLWSPSNHVLRDHEVFAGLPTQVMMDTAFRELRPERSIVSHRDRWLAGAVFYHFYGGQHHKQNYNGVSKADYGADLVPVRHGQGQFYLSTIPIAPAIATDRFAQRLLHNLAGWIGKQQDA